MPHTNTSTQVTTPRPAARDFARGSLESHLCSSQTTEGSLRSIGPWTPRGISYGTLNATSSGGVSAHLNWTLNLTELNWVNFELNELNFRNYQCLIELNWTNFPKQFWGRELNWAELKLKSFELWTRGSQKFTNCSGPGALIRLCCDFAADVSAFTGAWNGLSWKDPILQSKSTSHWS